MVVVGGLFCAAGMLMVNNATSYGGLVRAICLFGIGGGISMPSIMAMAVIKGNKERAMGSVISFITMAHSLGMMTGSMAAGLAMDHAELAVVFPFGAGVMVVGGVVFYLLVVSSR
jgi:predicted MFS family arabinose efflux permease